jgi:hypothetical protein
VAMTIKKYEKNYFSPMNCGKSLKLNEVARQKLMKP